MKSKKAIFFSTDALIAIGIIFLVILIAFPLIKQTRKETNLHYDALTVLSSLKTGETDNAFIQQLITDGTITNPNKTVLEQIGEFYAVGNVSLATQVADSVLTNIKTNENLGIWYGNTLIWSKNSTPFETAQKIDTARQTISGIQNGSSVTGFSARAFLTTATQTKYFYFGGYVGDGNLTANLSYNGNITTAKIEIAINNNFTLYVNNFNEGSYQASPDEFTPVSYTIPINNFVSGNNLIEFKGDNLHIAGGFIKITYESDVQYEQAVQYQFPGIDGLINLYDGFYIPSNLTSLEILLHYQNNYTPTFLNIGNTTVYESSVDGEQTITLDNVQLSSSLNYSDITKKTIPIRLGMKNVSYTINVTGEADIFSVTDLSGSMSWQCSSGGGICSYNQFFCESWCGGTWSPTKPIDSAKDANKVFIDSVLNASQNRVGLVGYERQVNEADYHALSNDNASLKAKVDEWTAGGATCICCGIDRATNDLLSQSNPDKIRSMVVMSDGEANRDCPGNPWSTGDAKQDAIQASCYAHDNYNITIHSVGFGGNADEQTLQQISTICGGGSYYYSDIDQLAEIYQQIAQEIVEGTFIEQTIEVAGNITTKLYPDSYIKFIYDQLTIPLGLITTLEKQFNSDTTGAFSIPADTTILETKVASYSGPRWTDNVDIDGTAVYKLSNYGQDYVVLGDPYSINIPNSLIDSNNTITLTTGVSPSNSTSGSTSNKIIYTTVKNISVFSSISGLANGCTWHIKFEDGTEIETDIPNPYQGAVQHCYYNETLPGGGNTEIGGQVANEFDAYQIAVRNLLREIDFDIPWNNKVDVPFTEQDLQISLIDVSGIPYIWSTEVQVRTWND